MTTPTTLVLGPSLGTTVQACWGPTIALLPDDVHVVAFELPGHAEADDGDRAGDTEPIPSPLTIAHLAAQILGRVEGSFVYAGDSVGGQIGLQLLLDAPDRVLAAALCCTGAKIGTEESWRERADQVRAGGTASLVEATAQRWFAPGFADRQPERAQALLETLRTTSDDGYVAVCGALSAYDAREVLGEITAPVVAVAGADDAVCPPELLRGIADGVQDGRLVVLDDVAHQAPAEAPEQVARIILELVEAVR